MDNRADQKDPRLGGVRTSSELLHHGLIENARSNYERAKVNTELIWVGVALTVSILLLTSAVACLAIAFFVHLQFSGAI
jgi:hypothetical protein